MELNYSERFLLALYLEYFDREYDVNDDRMINVGPGFLNRHIEMQNIFYLCRNFGVYIEDYGFVWDWLGPSSDRLMIALKELDKKSECIDHYYEEYNSKKEKWFNTYNEQLEYLLSDYCHNCLARKISLSSYVLQETMKCENGSMILAGMIYLYKTVLPSASKTRIFNELEKRFKVRGIQVDRAFEEMIWKELSFLGIVDIERKYPFERKKVLKQ